MSSVLDGIVAWLCSGDTLAVILISAFVVVCAVILGARIQRLARFILPTDCLTQLVVLFCLADLVLGLLPCDAYWWCPFWLGYVVGYWVAGRTGYSEVIMIEPVSRTIMGTPWVLYEEDGKYYNQEQSNRALLRRLITGLRCTVETDSPNGIDDNWRSNIRYPLFMPFRKDVLLIEAYRRDYTPVPIWWRFTGRQYHLTIRIAYGSMVSKAQLVLDDRYLEQMQDLCIDQANQIRQLQDNLGTKMIETVLQLGTELRELTPENRLARLMAEHRAKSVPTRPIAEQDTVAGQQTGGTNGTTDNAAAAAPAAPAGGNNNGNQNSR